MTWKLYSEAEEAAFYVRLGRNLAAKNKKNIAGRTRSTDKLQPEVRIEY